MKRGPQLIRRGGDMQSALEKLAAKLTGSDESIRPKTAHKCFGLSNYKGALRRLEAMGCIRWTRGGVSITGEGWWQLLKCRTWAKGKGGGQ